jgi:hypothetical protein
MALRHRLPTGKRHRTLVGETGHFGIAHTVLYYSQIVPSLRRLVDGQAVMKRADGLVELAVAGQ